MIWAQCTRRTSLLCVHLGLPAVGSVRSSTPGTGIRLASAAATPVADAMTSFEADDVKQRIAQLVPELTATNYKGRNGKVGVIGGCQAYTGAPFFAAMSSLRAGGDLAYVFCTPSASPVIKGYSPELIVLPILPELPFPDPAHPPPALAAAAAPQPHSDALCGWLEKARLGCLVIGPGLGDDPLTLAAAAAALRKARQLGLHLVIDGSGLNIVVKEPELVKGYNRCVLTPNIAEFGRLAAAVGVQLEGPIGTQWQQQAKQLAAALQGPLLLSKGPADIITDGSSSCAVKEAASLARAGGQGDVLAGMVGLFICWSQLLRMPTNSSKARSNQDNSSSSSSSHSSSSSEVSPLMLAAAGGAWVTRRASLAAFLQQGRGMVAGDLIPHLRDGVDWLRGLT